MSLYVVEVHHVSHWLERVGVAVLSSDGVCCCCCSRFWTITAATATPHWSQLPGAGASSAAPPCLITLSPRHPRPASGRQFSCVQAGCVMSLLCNMCSLQPHTRESISSPADEWPSPPLLSHGTLSPVTIHTHTRHFKPRFL